MNVKQGDLAIQIKSSAGNEGKVVRVLSFVGAKPFYEGFTWYKSIDDVCWLVDYGAKTPCSRSEPNQIAPVPDSWLRPISGLPDPESTDEQVTKPVNIPEGVPA